MALTQVDQGLLGTYAQYTGFKNRLINGAMVIDQRNAGASITANNSAFGVDRFKTITSQSSKLTVQQNAGSITPPAGFTNYLGYTSSSAYSVSSDDYFFIAHYIEGFNSADLSFGTASASAVTLSFWVRSSLTGAFGGSLRNSANSRSYPFSYTISSANTWEQKSITVAGETSGTWIGATNGIGLQVAFSLGMGSTYSGTAGAWASTNYASSTGATSVVGTNGATFYITGVQLEKGSTATSFDYRPYSAELAMCQRYFQTTLDIGVAVGATSSADATLFCLARDSSNARVYASIFPTKMRSTPTVTLYAENNATAGSLTDDSTGSTVTGVSTGNIKQSGFAYCTKSSGLSSGTAYRFNYTASAEL